MLLNFVDQLRKDLLTEREAVANAMASNAAKTIEDYRYMAGIVRGLDVFMGLMDDRLQAFTEDDR